MENPGEKPSPDSRAPSRAPAPRAPSRASAPRSLDGTVRRRNSREWAVQMLFALDMAPPEGTMDEFFSAFWEMERGAIKELNTDSEAALRSFDGEAAKPHRAFAESLVEGVRAHLDEIDAKIESYLENWTLQRIGRVDRNVLRCALYELLYDTETPPAIIINEAIDIAKYFSTRESGRFVNGILDRAAKSLGRPLRYRAENPHFT